MHELAVFIGRFQPFHNGHKDAVIRATLLANKVLILVGSVDLAESPKNPFSFEQRRDMILSSLTEVAHKIIVCPLPDAPEADWIATVQEYVPCDDKDVCLVGHLKDASSYYLKIFPQWKFVDMHPQTLTGTKPMDATRIRQLIFEDQMSFVAGVVPCGVYEFLNQWRNTEAFTRLQEEHQFIEKYKASWAVAPYAPTFVTTDAIVVQSGHILVVRRKFAPGKGLWALPGGFVSQSEFIQDSMLRELDEETSIKLQREVLVRCIHASKVFDNPFRSLRGRTITHAYLIKLDDTKPLAKVQGGDDAAEAFWMPISQFKTSRPLFFEDHHEIVTEMLRLL